jgi:hypothetical protein
VESSASSNDPMEAVRRPQSPGADVRSGFAPGDAYRPITGRTKGGLKRILGTGTRLSPPFVRPVMGRYASPGANPDLTSAPGGGRLLRRERLRHENAGQDCGRLTASIGSFDDALDSTTPPSGARNLVLRFRVEVARVVALVKLVGRVAGDAVDLPSDRSMTRSIPPRPSPHWRGACRTAVEEAGLHRAQFGTPLASAARGVVESSASSNDPMEAVRRPQS